MPEQGGHTNGDTNGSADEDADDTSAAPSAGPSQPPQERPPIHWQPPSEGRHAQPPTEPEPASSSAAPQQSLSDVPTPKAGSVGGSVRWQEPGVSKPRQPTVAEARQRDRARKAREEADRYAEEQEREREQRSAKRRKVLMGSAAVVGLVGAVALGYALLSDDDEVSATCVKDGTNEVVSDSYCSNGTSSGGGGMFIYAGSPYRYYYGGSNTGIGSTARGGTIELPKGTTGKTKSGSSISRGGFGSSSHGSSGS